MRSTNRNRNRAQRGMTLIETLVAVVVFTVVFLAALGLYQAANRAYMNTDAATIQQQNARFALDRIIESLRDAGANYNTTGNTGIPDEQLEGAWESAVFVRGDYDNSRETGLQTASHPYVTTGNDEIVGYVLRKPGANSYTITINADVTPSTGRDATRSGSTITSEETVNIAVAARSLAEQTAPPYELTRVYFDTAGNPVYQVIAQNVFRLSFNYKDAAGTEIIDFDTATGSADADRGTRANVRKIGVNLITMADRPDFGYTDPRTYTADAFGHTAPAAAAITRNRRKFDLSEEVLGVSLGRKGARHNTTPKVTILPPTSLTVCSGHHLNFYLSWPATATAGVATYRLHVTAASPVVNEYINVPALEYRYKQSDPTVQAYSFEVAGIAGASAGNYTTALVKTATHEAESIPSAPGSAAIAARNATTNSMLVRWPAVTRNTGTISASTCTTTGGGTSRPDSSSTGWGGEAVDLKEYRVYRKLAPAQPTGTFVPDNTNRVDNQPPWGDLQNTTPTSNSFVDNTAAPCGQYWYRVEAFDSDGRSDTTTNPDGSPAMSAAASYIPATGITPATPLAPNLVSMSLVGSNYVFTIDWPHVVRDSTGARAATAHYEILREQRIGSGAWGTPPLSSAHVYETNTLAQTMPSVDSITGQSMEYRYAVRAVYDCNALGDSNREATGPVLTIVCLPPAGNTISITAPASGTAVSRPYETGFTPAVALSGGAWTAANIQIISPAGTIVYDETRGSPYAFPFWNASALPDGTYTVRAIGQAGTCRSLPVSRSVILETGTCGLTLVNPFLFPDSGNPDDRLKQFEFRLQNTCDASAITIDGLSLTWSGAPSGAVINTVNYNGTDNTTGLTTGSGTLIPLTTTITIPAGSTSNLFRIVYNLQHTDGGTTWSSLIARTTSPAQNDETVTTPVTPIGH